MAPERHWKVTSAWSGRKQAPPWRSLFMTSLMFAAGMAENFEGIPR